jgi:hypothetical protein
MPKKKLSIRKVRVFKSTSRSTVHKAICLNKKECKPYVEQSDNHSYHASDNFLVALCHRRVKSRVGQISVFDHVHVSQQAPSDIRAANVYIPPSASVPSFLLTTITTTHPFIL